MSMLIGGLLAIQTAVTAPWPYCSAHRVVPDSVRRVRADSLAGRFAPVLSFAPGERFFPTIPFFTALDGDSLGGDSLKADFEDPWEVAPHLKDDLTHVSWNKLLDNYHDISNNVTNQGHGAMERGLKRVVVLYRVCSLAEEQSKRLVRFLKSDEQAFERFEDVRPLEKVLRKKPQFDVIQYFMYYLADKGLQGHPNDIELVSVFIPRDTTQLHEFRIIVGSGHSTRTPNNVLVLSSYHRGEDSLPENPYVMVELGGHSSAPDLPPFGRFTPGLDANWHAYDVWGTRDAQAAGGVGYLGKYAQALTFDRGYGSSGIYVFPPRFKLEAEMETAEQEIKGRPDSTARGGSREKKADHHAYRLLPVHLLFQLDTVLPYPANLVHITSAITEIQTRLCPPRKRNEKWCEGVDSVTWRSKRFADLDSLVRLTAIHSMRLWKEELVIDTTFNQFEPRNRSFPGLPRIVEQLTPTARERQEAARYRPWEHQSFMGECKKGNVCEGKADPTEVFKSHLFRPNTYTVASDGFEQLLLLGLTVAGTDGYELYSGFVVPAFRSRGFPVRLGGYGEVHLGLNRAWDRGTLSPVFRFLHEGHRNSIISWYVNGSWVPRRPEVIEQPDAGEFSVGGGASLLPWIRKNTATFPNVLRFRVGIRFDPLQGKDLLGRVRWELHAAVRQ